MFKIVADKAPLHKEEFGDCQFRVSLFMASTHHFMVAAGWNMNVQPFVFDCDHLAML
jgi:hypothetical protein